ncbi:hypothetical protein ACS127_16915 [Amphibacillus sp. Q70]|uniref:hypothetical protein n=1 Tax=Amphibacillus sp. Q70 TaxID=3453416 RepID=UPI003F84C571
MKKFSLVFFSIVFLLLLVYFVMDDSNVVDEDDSPHIHNNIPEPVFDEGNVQIITPAEVPSYSYDPTQPLDLSTLDVFEDPDGAELLSGNCREIEVDISELKHINIPPELITENNTVILSACEE